MKITNGSLVEIESDGSIVDLKHVTAITCLLATHSDGHMSKNISVYYKILMVNNQLEISNSFNVHISEDELIPKKIKKITKKLESERQELIKLWKNFKNIESNS